MERFTSFIKRQKIAAFWSGLLAVLNSSWKSMGQWIMMAVQAIRTMITVQKVQAAWAAITGALTGNWVALADGATVAATVGAGWYFANRGQSESDIEDRHSRARARAWS